MATRKTQSNFVALVLHSGKESDFGCSYDLENVKFLDRLWVYLEQYSCYPKPELSQQYDDIDPVLSRAK